MSLRHPLALAVLPLLLACDEPAADPLSPPGPQFDVAAEHAIHMEEQGQTIQVYLASIPAQQPVVIAHCGPAAARYVVQATFGTATHLGYSSVLNEMCVFPATPTSNTWSSHIVITAANGDEISGSMTGTAVVINPQGDYLWAAAPVHFTDGTGRFASAVLDASWHGGGNVFNRTVYGVLDGTLRYAASDASGS